jgi:hypothetical protein
MYKHVCVGVLAGLVAVAGVTAGAQSKDPYVGTWTLDLAKSTFKPGPAPKSTTVVIDAAGKGLKIAVDAVNADGTPVKWSFATQRDGKDVPVTGNPLFDTAATTQSSPTAGATEYKKGGKVVLTLKTSVSADGKTLTTTATGTNAQGQAVNNVSVYNKK